MAEHPLTVSELTQTVRQTLEQFPPLWVVGELSNFTQASSGHRYFTLVDEESQLKCVMWRSRQLSGFSPEPGMEVLAQGTLTVYDRRGEYQFNVSQLFQSGVGQQQLAFEALKQRLIEEGLFDEEVKRPLPEFPQIIGVVTSRTGAAIRDILNVLRRRAPWVRVVLRPALVQGLEAPEDIVQGIEALNAWGKADVLIVGRGGGSAEDLAAFNAEVVVRAVRDSAAPVISAVGHEVDYSLSDLAADCRAPTPSAAAELAVPDADDLREWVGRLTLRARDSIYRLLEENESILAHYSDSYSLRHVEDLVFQHDQHVDELQKDLFVHFRRAFDGKLEAYRRLSGQLGSLSPLSVLERGFSVTQRLDDGRLVQDAGTLNPGDRVRVRFAKGEAICQVEGVQEESLLT